MLNETTQPSTRAARIQSQGRVQRAFELSIEADDLIETAIGRLQSNIPHCTKLQALEWLIRQGAKRLPKGEQS